MMERASTHGRPGIVEILAALGGAVLFPVLVDGGSLVFSEALSPQSSWRALLTTAALSVAIASAAGALLAGFAWLGGRRPLPRLLLLSTPLAAALGIASLHLLSGPHISMHPWIGWMQAASIALACLASLAFTATILRARRPGALRRLLLPLLLATPAILLAADRIVLPGVYPAFHLGLMLATLLAGAAFGFLLASLRPAPAVPLLLAAAGTGLSGLVLASLGQLPGDRQDLRAAMLNPIALPVASRLQTLAPARWLNPVGPRSSAGNLEPLPRAATVPGGTLDRLLPARRELSVLVITMDAVRADRMGFLGYGRPVTPNLDRLAGRSAVFENAIAPSSASQISLCSMFQSLHPSSCDVIDVRERPELLQPPLPRAPLARRLQESGHRTAGVCSLMPPIFHTHFPFLADGMEEIRLNDTAGSMDGARVTEHALDLIEGFGADPFFLWVHYFDAHDPYEFRPGLLPRATAADAYDTEIAYVDREIGRLLAFLEERELVESTMIIVHSDHGEEFGEHGGRFHGTSLYSELVDVPLIIAIPGLPETRVAAPASLVDLPPTILQVKAISADGMEGESLLPWMIDGTEPPPPHRFALAQLRNPRALSPEIDALVSDDYKLIHHRRTGAWELYDRRRDRGERRNLAHREPDTLDRLQALLDRKRANLGAADASARGPSLKDVLDDLSSLGTEEQRGVLDRLLARGDCDLLADACEKLLNTEDAPAQDLALRTLAIVPSERFRSRISGLLASGDREIRLRAMLAACHHLDASELRDRIQPLMAGSDPPLAAGAAIVLQLCGDPGGTKLVEALMPSLAGEARALALLGRARLGDRRARLLRASLLREPCISLLLHSFAVRGALADRSSTDLIDLFALTLRPGGSQDYLPSETLLQLARTFEPREAVPLLRHALARRDNSLRLQVAEAVGADLLARPWANRPMERLFADDSSRPLRSAEARLRAARRGAEAGVVEWGLVFQALATMTSAGLHGQVATLLERTGWDRPDGPGVFPDFVRRIGRLAGSPPGPVSATIRLDWHDPAMSSSGEIWIAEVAVELPPEGPPLPGGPSGAWLLATATQEGRATPLAAARIPLPLQGLLPGESSPLLVVLAARPEPGLPVCIGFELAGAGASATAETEVSVR